MRKLKLLALAVLVTATLGAVGLALRPGDEARAQEEAAGNGGLRGEPPGRLDDPDARVDVPVISVAKARAALNGLVMYTETARYPLPVSLKYLEDQMRAQGKAIDIDLDLTAIRKARPDLCDVEQLQVLLTKRERPFLLKYALQEILDQHDLAFALVLGRILVGPRAAVLRRAVEQPVNLDAEGVDLRQVLRRLADQTGVNIVLDSRAKAVPKVTLVAHEMPLRAAVRVLAEMADLKAVLVPGNVFYLTTKERADLFRREIRKGCTEAIDNRDG
jgi:hypothetical protein